MKIVQGLRRIKRDPYISLGSSVFSRSRKVTAPQSQLRRVMSRGFRAQSVPVPRTGALEIKIKTPLNRG